MDEDVIEWPELWKVMVPLKLDPPPPLSVMPVSVLLFQGLPQEALGFQLYTHELDSASVAVAIAPVPPPPEMDTLGAVE